MKEARDMMTMMKVFGVAISCRSQGSGEVPLLSLEEDRVGS